MDGRSGEGAQRAGRAAGAPQDTGRARRPGPASATGLGDGLSAAATTGPRSRPGALRAIFPAVVVHPVSRSRRPPVEPVEILFVIGVFVIPALAVSARIALRPIVDALVRLPEALPTLSAAPDSDEIRELRTRIEYLEDRLASVEETADFHRELASPRAPGDRRLLADRDG